MPSSLLMLDNVFGPLHRMPIARYVQCYTNLESQTSGTNLTLANTMTNAMNCEHNRLHNRDLTPTWTGDTDEKSITGSS